MQIEELQVDMLTFYVQRYFFNKIMCFLVFYSAIFLPLYLHIYKVIQKNQLDAIITIY